MDKTRTTVIIGGKEYALSSSDSAEHLHRVAIFVDRKLQESGKGIYTVSPLTGMMLTALNIADDFLKLDDQQEDLREQYKAQQELIVQQRERLAELQAQVLRLQREVSKGPEGRRLSVPGNDSVGRRTSDRGK